MSKSVEDKIEKATKRVLGCKTAKSEKIRIKACVKKLNDLNYSDEEEYLSGKFKGDTFRCDVECCMCSAEDEELDEAIRDPNKWLREWIESIENDSE